MDQDVEAELYNDIGAAVVEEVGTADTKILIYVENGDDSFGTVIWYLDSDEKHIRGAFSNSEIAGALTNLRSYLSKQSSDRMWKSMEYWIEYGQIDVKLSYDSLDPKMPIWERTPAIVEKYFPGAPLKDD